MKNSRKETTHSYENSPLKKIIQQLLLKISQLKEKYPIENTLGYDNASQWVFAFETMLHTVDAVAPKLEGNKEDISLSSIIGGLIVDGDFKTQIGTLISLSRTCRLIEIPDTEEFQYSWAKLYKLMDGHNAIFLQGEDLFSVNIAKQSWTRIHETDNNKKSHQFIKTKIRSKLKWADSDTVSCIRTVMGNSFMATRIHHPLMYELVVEMIQVYISAPKELEVLIPFVKPSVIQVDLLPNTNPDSNMFTRFVDDTIAKAIAKLLGYNFKIEHVTSEAHEHQKFNYDYTELKDGKKIEISVNATQDFNRYKEAKIQELLDEILCYLKVYHDTEHAQLISKFQTSWLNEYVKIFEETKKRIVSCQSKVDKLCSEEVFNVEQINSLIQKLLDSHEIFIPQYTLELKQLIESIPKMTIPELLAQKKYREEGFVSRQLKILNKLEEKIEEKFTFLKNAWKKKAKKEYEQMLKKFKEYESILQPLSKCKPTKSDEASLNLLILESKVNITTLETMDFLQIKEQLLKKLTPIHFNFDNDDFFKIELNSMLERVSDNMDTLIGTKNNLRLIFEKQIQESYSALQRIEDERERLKREADFALKMKNLNPKDVEDLAQKEKSALIAKETELEAHRNLQDQTHQSFQATLLLKQALYKKTEANILQKNEWIQSLSEDEQKLVNQLPKPEDYIPIPDNEMTSTKTLLVCTKDLLSKPINLPSVTILEQLKTLLNAPKNDRCIPFEGMEKIFSVGTMNTLLLNLGCEKEQIDEVVKFRKAEETYFSQPGHNTRIKFRTLLNSLFEHAIDKINYLERIKTLVINIEYFQDAKARNQEDLIPDMEEKRKLSLEISQIEKTMEENQQDALAKEDLLRKESVSIKNKYESLSWCLSILNSITSVKNALERFSKNERYDDAFAIDIENEYKKLMAYKALDTFDVTIVENIQAARLAFDSTINISKTIEDKYRLILDAIDFSEVNRTYEALQNWQNITPAQFLEDFNRLKAGIVTLETQLQTEKNTKTSATAKTMIVGKKTLLTQLKQNAGTLGITYKNSLLESLNAQAIQSALFIGDAKESRDMKATNESKILVLEDFLANFPGDRLLQEFTASVEALNPPLENQRALVVEKLGLRTSLENKQALNANLVLRIDERQTQVDTIFSLFNPHLEKRKQTHPIYALNLQEKLLQFVESGDDSDILDVITGYLKEHPGTKMRGILSKAATVIIDLKRKVPNQYERVEPSETVNTEDAFVEDVLVAWRNNTDVCASTLKFSDSIKAMAIFADKLPAAERDIIKNLSISLRAELNHFLQTTKNALPTTQVFNTFSQAFLFRLHSEDERMSQHRALWKPIVLNISIAATGLGLIIIAAQLVISKVQTGRARFFGEYTARENHVESVDSALSGLSYSIAQEV